MDIKPQVLQETALTHNLPYDVTEEIINSQFKFMGKIITNDNPKDVVVFKMVGKLISYSKRRELVAECRDEKQNK